MLSLRTLKLVVAFSFALALPYSAVARIPGSNVIQATLLSIRLVDDDQKTNSAPASPAPSTNTAVEMTPATPSPSVPASTNAAPIPAPGSTPTPTAAPKFVWSSVKVDGPYIAMTFDDGPNPKNTPKLLDLLAQKHIHATFFVVGENAVRMPDILKRMIAEGHEIGNHSWDHPNFGKSSDEKIRSQIQRTSDAIFAGAGVKPTLLRPPYGSMTPKQRQWVHEEFGLDIILWDVDPDDWKEPGVDVVAQRIISGTRSGSIILSHDIHAPTIEAMPQVFDALLAKGYKFVTVSELIAMHNPNLQPAPAASQPTTLSSTETTPAPAKPKSSLPKSLAKKSPPKPSSSNSSPSAPPSNATAPTPTKSVPHGIPPLPVYTRP